MSVIKKALEELRKAQFEDDGEIWNDDEIVCPYCFFEFSDSWEYKVHRNLESEDEVECQKCGKKFTCYSECTISYRSTRQ